MKFEFGKNALIDILVRRATILPSNPLGNRVIFGVSDTEYFLGDDVERWRFCWYAFDGEEADPSHADKERFAQDFIEFCPYPNYEGQWATVVAADMSQIDVFVITHRKKRYLDK